MAQRNLQVTGSGKTTRTPTDPALAGGVISPDPAFALTGGAKQISPDPETAAADVAAKKVKVNY